MNEKSIIVTCALPYANGELHLGHIVSTYLPADVFSRFYRLNGVKVVFICATDDYGTPILIKSEQENKTPAEYVDYWNKRDLKDFSDLGISFDFFNKTSSEENKKLTQYFFLKLLEKEYIYKKYVDQFYCTQDKKFLPDRYVLGICPFCGAEQQYSDGCEACGRTFSSGEIKDPKCIICGQPPINKISAHYFFKLSNLSSELKTWLTEAVDLQIDVKNYVLNWVTKGLRDWDITRDISWGVPVPLDDAKGKVFYGWFDNHLCYISSTMTYLKSKGIDGKSFWNSSRIFHFIGKDIVYHHYLFLPAMRIGINKEYALPSSMPTRGHLLLQGQKFSKSRGWYIGLRDFLNHFDADYLRYYLSSITSYSQSDVNFDWRDFQAKINNELVANIGNFIYRTLSFIYTKFDGKVPEPIEPSQIDLEFLSRFKKTALQAGSYIENNNLDKGLKTIVDFSAFCNQYFQKMEPWKKGKGSQNCLYYSVNAVRSLAILLNPYIPNSTEELWKQLSLPDKVFEQRWENATKLAITPKHTISIPKILFIKIDDSLIESQQKKLENFPK